MHNCNYVEFIRIKIIKTIIQVDFTQFPSDLFIDYNKFRLKIMKRYKEFSNRDITISYLYMNAPLNIFNELSMSKR